MKTQRQRSAERKKRDKEDHFACMDRENWICQRCGAPATQTHHGKRKHLHVRHNPSHHYALCYTCHDWAHKHVSEFNQWTTEK